MSVAKCYCWVEAEKNAASFFAETMIAFCRLGGSKGRLGDFASHAFTSPWVFLRCRSELTV